MNLKIMSLGSTRNKNGGLMYQFNVSEKDMNDMLENHKEVTLNLITGNKDYEAIHFELSVKNLKKTKK